MQHRPAVLFLALALSACAAAPAPSPSDLSARVARLPQPPHRASISISEELLRACPDARQTSDLAALQGLVRCAAVKPTTLVVSGDRASVLLVRSHLVELGMPEEKVAGCTPNLEEGELPKRRGAVISGDVSEARARDGRTWPELRPD
jgi:hypothetical protein